MGESTTAVTPAATATTTSAHDAQISLIIVVCIGGVIITASIIIIIVVAVFVRKSTRELKQQTRANQNRPQGPRPAHANSVRIAQGPRAEVVRGQPEVNAAPDSEDAQKGQGEIQGYYAVIPRSEDLGTSPEGQRDSGEKGIVYAALEFDDATGKPGKLSEETESFRRLTGSCVVVPSTQPDTYVEMEPLVATVRKDSAPVECYPAECLYSLAKDPEVEVQPSTGGISPGQINPGMYHNSGDKNSETLIHTVI